MTNFIQIESDPHGRKNDVMSICEMALGFQGYNNGFFEKPMYDLL